MNSFHSDEVLRAVAAVLQSGEKLNLPRGLTGETGNVAVKISAIPTHTAQVFNVFTTVLPLGRPLIRPIVGCGLVFHTATHATHATSWLGRLNYRGQMMSRAMPSGDYEVVLDTSGANFRDDLVRIQPLFPIGPGRRWTIGTSEYQAVFSIDRDQATTLTVTCRRDGRHRTILDFAATRGDSKEPIRYVLPLREQSAKSITGQMRFTGDELLDLRLPERLSALDGLSTVGLFDSADRSQQHTIAAVDAGIWQQIRDHASSGEVARPIDGVR